jgi:Leucine-rich repeat (LRR) protein
VPNLLHPPGFLEQFPNLTNLNLSFNENIIHVSHLTNLKKLDLLGNSVISEEELVNLIRLKNLILSPN